MAYTNQLPVFVTTQPQSGVNPFYDYNQDWSVGLCDCCTDVGQCKWCHEMMILSIKRWLFSGCYAYFCYCCFIGSLAGDINESKASCCCCGNILAVYRMKVRATLKIRVGLFYFNHISFLFSLSRAIHILMPASYVGVHFVLLFKCVTN
jgi:hypothetical protein